MSAATQEAQTQSTVQLATVERTLDLERIAEQVEERRLAEIAAREQPAEEVETPEVVETPAPVVEAKPEDQVTKQMRKVKVDGEELEVSEDDLVASYQKQAAATRRLQEAERILADAKAQAVQIIAPPAVEVDLKAKRLEYHQALIDGDLDKADTLFDELTQGRPEKPIPDAQQIIQQVTPVIKQQLSNESALERFEKDYADALKDEDFVTLTKTKMDRLMAEGKPYPEALHEAGRAAKERLEKPSVSPPATTTTTRAEKLEKKDAITQIPSANSKAQSTAEREQSTSEIIAEERKRRGLE